MGDTASNMIFGLISSYSLMFFTDVAMLPIGIITTLLLLSRIWDTVNDPVMGMLSDRIELKWGKYRSFFLILPILLAAALVLTFFSPGLGTTGKLVYTFIAYNALMMLYTAINVPYGALITTMTNGPQAARKLQLHSYIGRGAGQPDRQRQRAHVRWAVRRR